jgi:nucleotide-binding universal stress UspA family protein
MMSGILRNAECPVIVSPLNSDHIEEVVFAYDGSPSSVYAIKQFTHLFPQFEDKRLLFLEVNKDDSTEIMYKGKITDYLKMHYSSVGFHILHGDAANELLEYFVNKKNVIIVIGAFGRNAISSFFNRSTAHLLLEATGLPMFITHK